MQNLSMEQDLPCIRLIMPILGVVWETYARYQSFCVDHFQASRGTLRYTFLALLFGIDARDYSIKLRLKMGQSVSFKSVSNLPISLSRTDIDGTTSCCSFSTSVLFTILPVLISRIMSVKNHDFR